MIITKRLLLPLGDDDMKRTIAKSWYESQQKQGGGGGGSDPMAAFGGLNDL